MTNKNAVVTEGKGSGAENTTPETKATKNRDSLMVDLSPATLTSIESAATRFGSFGLNINKARQLVAAEIERRSADISAVDLFAAEVQAKLKAMQEA